MIGNLLTRFRVFFHYQLAVSPRELRGGMVLLCLILCAGLLRLSLDSFERENLDSEVLPELIRKDSRVLVSANYRRCPDPMDVNVADTILLRRLHGIGKVLSRRIIRYRELLGGFITPEQVGEVYGISDSTMHHILPRIYVDDTFLPEKLDLETATYTEMYDHPYITSREATAILRFREQHNGRIRLNQVLSFKPERRKKILPYVVESADSD